MDTIFVGFQTVGEIVAIMPKASEVFKQYKIDPHAALPHQRMNENSLVRTMTIYYFLQVAIL